MIQWNSDESHWIVNPKLSDDEKNAMKLAQSQAPKTDAIVWIRSSGTTAKNKVRWIALSKAAILASAEAVNRHLQATSKDIWLQALPDFHVGGLSIKARAFLSKSKVFVYDDRWDAKKFVHLLASKKITLTSLVPTQVYDIVLEKIPAPSSVRAIVVGGGHLSEPLYQKAKSLGWPLLPSYGLTEVASQVATAELKSLDTSSYPKLKVLNHVHCSTNAQGILFIQSKALFRGDLVIHLSTQKVTWQERHQQQPFQTQDLVEIDAGYLTFLGRTSQMVKVLGEQVSLLKLNDLLTEGMAEQGIGPEEWTVLDRPHSRMGSEIVLVCQQGFVSQAEKAISIFNTCVERYERVTSIYFIEHMPRTELGKVRVNKTLQILSNSSTTDELS